MSYIVILMSFQTIYSINYAFMWLYILCHRERTGDHKSRGRFRRAFWCGFSSWKRKENIDHSPKIYIIERLRREEIATFEPKVIIKEKCCSHDILLAPGQELTRVPRLCRQGHSPSRDNFSSCEHFAPGQLCPGIIKLFVKRSKSRLKLHLEHVELHKNLLFDWRYH
jgi:hypothetical protein